jgi:hypothetical protein
VFFKEPVHSSLDVVNNEPSENRHRESSYSFLELEKGKFELFTVGNKAVRRKEEECRLAAMVE